MDITVEDPSDEFTAVRDFVDCKDALKLECFQPPKVHQPFSEEIEAQCRQKLKLQKVNRIGLCISTQCHYCGVVFSLYRNSLGECMKYFG